MIRTFFQFLLSIFISFVTPSALADDVKTVPVTTPASPWIGTYVPIPHSGSYIKKAEIVSTKGSGVKIRAWVEVGKIGEGTGPFEFSLETEAREYNDCNSKAADSCLIASFPESKYKPIIIFTRGALTKLLSSKKYQSILYKCYLQGYSGECYMKGRLDREE